MNEKKILRAQWDGRMRHWRIVQKTYNGAGGWKKFSEWYLSKDKAEEYIDSLVADLPEQYEKEP
jgi:hypothetical protein